MKRFIGVVVAATIALSAGCASIQAPVPLNLGALAAKPTRVGIALSTIPKPDTLFPGAGCLLCLAAASVANSSLTTYAGTLPTDDLTTLPKDIAERLRASGIDAKAIDDRIDLKALPTTRGSAANMPKRDFRNLGATYGVDKLIVLELAVLGFERTYSGYIPTGDPKGVVVGSGYMVDLQSNGYEWYTPVRMTKSSEGNWDEPPKYPGLTNAYFQALELSKDALLQPFAAP